VRDDEREHLLLHTLDALLEALQLRTGLLGHFGVVNADELANLRELVVVFPERGRQIDDPAEALVLAAE
jgi:hypothetical protein